MVQLAMLRDWDAFFTSEYPIVMGILNITPDSFFSESRFDPTEPDRLANAAIEMVLAGAGIIDLGAESTRPGAEDLDLQTELDRLIPALKAVRNAVDVPISIDTRKSAVAKAALAEGADIINDISALRADSQMATLAAELNCPVIIMHMQGNPRTMQTAPSYDNVVKEVRDFLSERIDFARSAGIQHIVIDPGLGFGKRQSDNLALLASIEEFRSLECPVLVGHSRKGFIGSSLADRAGDLSQKPRPIPERLAGSLAVAVWCATRKVAILRVHDVAETVDALHMTRILQEFPVIGSGLAGASDA